MCHPDWTIPNEIGEDTAYSLHGILSWFGEPLMLLLLKPISRGCTHVCFRPNYQTYDPTQIHKSTGQWQARTAWVPRIWPWMKRINLGRRTKDYLSRGCSGESVPITLRQYCGIWRIIMEEFWMELLYWMLKFYQKKRQAITKVHYEPIWWDPRSR